MQTDTVSPYLLRPRRTLAKAITDQLQRLDWPRHRARIALLDKLWPYTTQLYRR
jgi:hypothetical protein